MDILFNFPNSIMQNSLTMEPHSFQNFHSSYEQSFDFDEEPFLLSNQLHPLDFSEYSSFNCQWEMPSVMESLPNESLYSSPMEILMPSENTYEDSLEVLWENNEVGFDKTEPDKQIVAFDSMENGEEQVKKVHGGRRRKKSGSSLCSCSEISRETISRCFYMPITHAAKKLNVGLTQLKKRCRELGIPRWPHRKLMSLNALIKNVKEMGAVEGEAAASKITKALDALERQRKLMEEMPEVELEENTKRLRQAYFKANYKRRRIENSQSPIVGMLEWRSPSSKIISFESSQTSSSTNNY